MNSNLTHIGDLICINLNRANVNIGIMVNIWFGKTKVAIDWILYVVLLSDNLPRLEVPQTREGFHDL